MIIQVPISLGELVDKITILQIKQQEINNEDKLKNINYEHDLLNNILQELHLDSSIEIMSEELFNINHKIWILEDERRELENTGNYTEKLVEVSRQIHINNDERSKVKRIINTSFGSTIIEEKSFS